MTDNRGYYPSTSRISHLKTHQVGLSGWTLRLPHIHGPKKRCLGGCGSVEPVPELLAHVHTHVCRFGHFFYTLNSIDTPAILC